MKRIIAATVIMLIVMTGCEQKNFLPQRLEIGELNLVRVIAVDKGKEDGNILVTVTSKKEGEAGGTGGGEGGQTSGEQVIVLSEEGPTVESAIRQFQTYINKRVFWGHSSFYLIGEEAAREDIVKYVDFFVRDHALRLDSTVHITKGKAGDFLEKSNAPGFFIGDFLKSLIKDISLVSYSDSMDISELISDLDENTTFGIAVPVISLVEGTVREKGMENALNKAVKQEGYAIIKDYKLVEFLDPPDSRGYNTIANKLVSGFINARDQSGMNLGLEILKSETKIRPIVEKGQLTGVKIKCHLETNIDEVQAKIDVFLPDSIVFLEQQQGEVIKGEMEKCIQIAQQTNADFLGIGEAVHLKHPVIWDKIKDQWNEIFPELDITVEVESHINRTYDIREPTGYKDGD